MASGGPGGVDGAAGSGAAEGSGAAPGSTPGSAVGPGASRCAWCAGGDGELRELVLRVPDAVALNRFWARVPVHPRHERPVRRFLARYRRDGRRFVLSMVAMVVAVFAFYAAVHAVEMPGAVRERWKEMFLGPWLTGMGVVFLLFPFATGLTNRLLGIRHTVLLVRGAGLAFVGFGLWEAARAFL